MPKMTLTQALLKIKRQENLLRDAAKQLDYCNYGDSWERSGDWVRRLKRKMEKYLPEQT
jgi:hypothetical protein